MFEHGLLWASLMLAFTLTKAALASLLVIYPSYKSYKALESRSLEAAQGMLLYWCLTAFVNSGKEIADQILGTYSNIFVWKLTVLALKAAPLIIGPERMYRHIIKPLFDRNAEQVDQVVDEAHKLKKLAQEAVPAVKEGDVQVVKQKAGEIASEIKDSTGEIVESIKESVLEHTAALQQKTEELGVTWNQEGAMAVLSQLMTGVEHARDAGVEVAAQQWKAHGPFLSEKAGVVKQKGAELYASHAPILQQKAIDAYQQKVLPRVQPAITAVNNQYSSVRAKADDQWQQRGGPLRKFYSERVLPLYRSKIEPFYTNTAKPFFLHSFLPAVWETLVALKDRLIDLFSPPSEEVRSQRAQRRLRRRESNEKRAQWKRRGDKVKDKWAGQWKEMEAEATDAASSGVDVAEKAISRAATLTNRKTKESTDSSLERSHVVSAEESDLNPAAPVFEPKLTPEVIGEPNKLANASNKEEKLLGSELNKEGGLYTNEPRSAGIIQ